MLWRRMLGWAGRRECWTALNTRAAMPRLCRRTSTTLGRWRRALTICGRTVSIWHEGAVHTDRVAYVHMECGGDMRSRSEHFVARLRLVNLSNATERDAGVGWWKN